VAEALDDFDLGQLPIGPGEELDACDHLEVTLTSRRSPACHLGDIFGSRLGQLVEAEIPVGCAHAHAVQGQQMSMDVKPNCRVESLNEQDRPRVRFLTAPSPSCSFAGW
jgi:hypothetical protein